MAGPDPWEGCLAPEPYSAARVKALTSLHYRLKVWGRWWAPVLFKSVSRVLRGSMDHTSACLSHLNYQSVFPGDNDILEANSGPIPYFKDWRVPPKKKTRKKIPEIAKLYSDPSSRWQIRCSSIWELNLGSCTHWASIWSIPQPKNYLSKGAMLFIIN